MTKHEITYDPTAVQVTFNSAHTDLRQIAAAVVHFYRQPKLTLGHSELIVVNENNATREITFQAVAPIELSSGLTDEQAEALTDLFARRMAERSRDMYELTTLLGECCQELGL